MPEKVGRYKILDELGRGSMGTVYRAEDGLIGRIVALKTVPRPGPTSPPQELEAYARFLREARAAGTFLHPNVVTVFDVGEDAVANLSYIAMELVQGESLDHFLRRRKAFDWDEIRRIGWQTASALKAAHQAGIVHRDIKPANLIYTASGDVKVADFGIAKIANAQMTQDGSLLGSPGYMSPEQVRAASVDHRSDIFSLGVVLYELATLRPAFPGRNVFEVITQVANVQYKRPREVRPEIPADLEAIILRATAKDREKRFQNAQELMDALVPPAPPVPAVPNVTIISRSGRIAAPVEAADRSEATTTRAIPAGASVSAGRAARAARAGGRRAGPAPILLAAGGLAVVAVAAVLALVRGGGGAAAVDAPAETPRPAAAVLEPSEPAPLPLESAVATPPPGGAPAGGAAASLGTPAATATPARRRAAAGTTARPTAAPASRFRLAVTHPHATSVCRGTLTVDEAGIAYDSRDKDEDDVRWSWEDVGKLRVGDGYLEVAGRKKGIGGLFSKGARFRAEDNRIPPDLASFVRSHAGRD